MERFASTLLASALAGVWVVARDVGGGLDIAAYLFGGVAAYLLLAVSADVIGAFARFPRVAAACELLALFVVVHLRTGTLRGMKPGSESLHYGLFGATLLLSLTLWIPWSQRVAARAGDSKHSVSPPVGPGKWWALWSGVVGVAALEIDRRALPQLYPAVHGWLTIVGALSIDAALSPWLGRLQHRAVSLAGALAGIAIAVLGLRFAAQPDEVQDPVFRTAVYDTPVGWALLDLHPRRETGRNLGPGELLDHERYPNETRDGGENLLLVSIDTLRHDVAAPRLDGLRARCASFRRAYATGSHTMISMGPLMLGRYSANIRWKVWMSAGGKILGPRNADTPRGDHYHTTLPDMPEAPTLAERLRARGLWTMATPYGGNADYFAQGYGFERGFDDYAAPARNRWELPTSDHVAREAIAQWDRCKASRWFQWIHFYDPHEGYKAGYDELVRSTDAALGTVLDELERRGLGERTVVVVLSDHGEGFGVHRESRHGTALYDEQIHVPLVVCVPGRPPGAFDQPVSTLDATATLLALAGASLDGIDGVNLLPLLYEGRYPERRPIFSELHRYGDSTGARTHDMKAIVLEDDVLIADRHYGTLRMYGLLADPGQTRNIAHDEAERAHLLERELTAFVQRGEASYPLP